MGSGAKADAGVTLVEILISAMLIGILLLALLSVIHSANMLSDSSREGTIASHELQAALEDTYAVPFSQFKTAFPNGSYLPEYDNTTLPDDQKRPLRDERIRIDYLQESPDAVSYELTIEFKNHKGFTQKERLTMRRSK